MDNLNKCRHNKKVDDECLACNWNAAIEVCIRLVKEEIRMSIHNKEMLIHRMGVAKK